MKITFEDGKHKISFAYNDKDNMEIITEDGKNVTVFELNGDDVETLIKGLTLISQANS